MKNKKRKIKKVLKKENKSFFPPQSFSFVTYGQQLGMLELLLTIIKKLEKRIDKLEKKR